MSVAVFRLRNWLASVVMCASCSRPFCDAELDDLCPGCGDIEDARSAANAFLERYSASAMVAVYRCGEYDVVEYGDEHLTEQVYVLRESGEVTGQYHSTTQVSDCEEGAGRSHAIWASEMDTPPACRPECLLEPLMCDAGLACAAFTGLEPCDGL